jgi:hypothetical protein
MHQEPHMVVSLHFVHLLCTYLQTPMVPNIPLALNIVVADSGALSFLLHQILLYFIVVVAPSSIIIHASYCVVQLWRFVFCVECLHPRVSSTRRT